MTEIIDKDPQGIQAILQNGYIEARKYKPDLTLTQFTQNLTQGILAELGPLNSFIKPKPRPE